MLSPIKDSSSDQLGFSQGFMLIDTGGFIFLVENLYLKWLDFLLSTYKPS